METEVSPAKSWKKWPSESARWGGGHNPKLNRKTPAETRIPILAAHNDRMVGIRGLRHTEWAKLLDDFR